MQGVFAKAPSAIQNFCDEILFAIVIKSMKNKYSLFWQVGFECRQGGQC